MLDNRTRSVRTRGVKLLIMQSVVVQPHSHQLDFALGRFGSGWRISDSLMELSFKPPCSCPRSCSGCGTRLPRMHVSCNKTKILGVMMMVNFLIYILVEVSRSYGKLDPMKPQLPAEQFWKKSELSDAFWNHKQQHLDYIHNPLFISSTTAATSVSQPDTTQTISTRKTDRCKPDDTIPAHIKDYSSLPQHFKDFLLYMKCRSYPMLIDAPGVCSETPFLLLAVKSLAPHFDRRQAIRESWGRAGILANRRVATVFILGKTSRSDFFPNVTEMLRYEASLHADLLQWDYRDTFFNLTLKEVLFLEWWVQRCPSARFVFKGDDDVFVNTLNILNFLNKLSDKKARDLFVGDVISEAGPHRDKKLKYYIPESFFVGAYPPYAGGGGYLYSSDLGIRLRNISRQVSLFPIDDVYTGMCLQKLGLVPEKHQGFRTFDIEEKHRESPCIYKSLMLVHPRGPQEMIKIWGWISDPGLSCP